VAARLRVVFRKPYAIYYIAQQTEITLVRVLHGARDVVAIAEDEGFILDEE